jgi:hypothetical protein
MQAEYLSRDGANGEESIGDWGALEAPRGRTTRRVERGPGGPPGRGGPGPARAERRAPAGDRRVWCSSIGGRGPHAPARCSSSGGDGRRRSRAHADSDQIDCPSLVSAPSDGRARASQANWLRMGGGGGTRRGGRRGHARRSTLLP